MKQPKTPWIQWLKAEDTCLVIKAGAVLNPSQMRKLARYLLRLSDYVEKKKKAKKKPSNLKCSSCEKKSPDVVKRIDPYQQDVNNTTVYKNLCNICYQNHMDDI